jgi:hypothetical protein
MFAWHSSPSVPACMDIRAGVGRGLPPPTKASADGGRDELEPPSASRPLLLRTKGGMGNGRRGIDYVTTLLRYTLLSYIHDG